ncbi:hypothetical protein AMATHDRAFT_62794 [Amanita thiersii Skay4041]|uniref:Uncharacterized protein n=1 Tax=Amanita thiersii Skay4041 TaxID=703135 RepID=A0A2A9NJU1_9AGAR|nr:hypothetical protein AMATHDRAFT_62794 [Amanita thiersii Skay4041]
MRAFSTLSFLTALSGTLFASAIPLSGSNRYPRGGDVVDIDSVNAIVGAAVDAASAVGVNNVLNHQVTQTQSRRGGPDVVDLDTVNVIVSALVGATSDVKVDNVLNHNVQQSARDVVDVDEVNAIVGAAVGVVSTAGVNNIANSNVQQSARRDVPTSIPVVILDVCAKLVPISKKLNTLIAANVEVKAEVVVGILGEVKAILEAAVADIKIIVANPTGAIFTLQGRVLAYVEVAHIIVAFLVIVFAILVAAVTIVGTVKAYVIASVLLQIGGCIAAVLTLVFSLHAEILVAVTPLIEGLVPTILGFHFADVCAALKLTH